MEITLITGVAIGLMVTAFTLMGISLYLFLREHSDD